MYSVPCSLCIHIYPKTKRLLKHIKKHLSDHNLPWFLCIFLPRGHNAKLLMRFEPWLPDIGLSFCRKFQDQEENNAASNGFLLLNYWKVSILRKWSTLHLPYVHVAHVWSMKCIPTSKHRSFVPLQTLTESCSALVLQIWHRQIFRNFNGDKNLHTHNIYICIIFGLDRENLMLRFASCK